MKACFDTSVLVAALLRQHPQHPVAFAKLFEVQQKRLEGVLTTHGVAEVFATLTALPLKPRLQPGDAQKMLQRSIFEAFHDPGTHRQTLFECPGAYRRSGIDHRCNL
jgi:predicted nucleic acid-binding protein